MGTVREMRQMRRECGTDGWTVAVWILSAAVSLGVCWLLGAAAAGAAEPAVEPNDGFTGWVLLGANPEFGRSEEIRLGYEGLFERIELAVGAQHLDGPEPGVEEWSGRAYLIAHALDANMIASVLGYDVDLPPGNLYAGLFGQYSYDRDDEWSGGYLIGGLVEWPWRWQTVAEYQHNVWNNDHDSYAFVVGLRRRF